MGCSAACLRHASKSAGSCSGTKRRGVAVIVLFLGLPGSGKGTQVRLLSSDTRLPVLAMGDVLRRETSEQTEMGKRVKPYVVSGRPLPVGLIHRVLTSFLRESGLSVGFVGDGIVRTVGQAGVLDAVLSESGTNVHRAMVLDVPERELRARLEGRLICCSCGAVYHRTTSPPRRSGACDIDNSSLEARGDDVEHIISRRLRIQGRSFTAVTDYYARTGVLRRIDGVGSVEDVASRVRRAL